MSEAAPKPWRKSASEVKRERQRAREILSGDGSGGGVDLDAVRRVLQLQEVLNSSGDPDGVHAELQAAITPSGHPFRVVMGLHCGDKRPAISTSLNPPAPPARPSIRMSCTGDGHRSASGGDEQSAGRRGGERACGRRGGRCSERYRHAFARAVAARGRRQPAAPSRGRHPHLHLHLHLNRHLNLDLNLHLHLHLNTLTRG